MHGIAAGISQIGETFVMFTLVIIGLILTTCGCAVAMSPDLQRSLGLHTEDTADAATSAIEKQENEYNVLFKMLPGQRASVAKLMVAATSAAKELAKRQSRMLEIARNYQRAKNMQNIKPETLDAYGEQFEDAKQAISLQQAILTEAQSMATQAQLALDQTDKALRKFKDKISNDKALKELAEALNTNASALQQAKDLQSQASAAGKASAEVNQALEVARARTELAKGTRVERELADLDQENKATKGRAELDAMLSDNGGNVELAVLLTLPIPQPLRRTE
jgi:hypothetical protein